MKCPDWRVLIAERDRSLSESPDPSESGDFEAGVSWIDAVDHLSGCGSCRGVALSLDPTLLFTASAPFEVSDDEIESLKVNVHTLVRSRRTERASLEPRKRLGRLAAAAVGIAAMVLLPTHTSQQPVVIAPLGGPMLVADSPYGSNGLLGEGPAPLIEPFDLPLARIYQLGEEDLSVVMVVDESIDV